ncbi:unnamed protein product, partial [Allacma fusca]
MATFHPPNKCDMSTVTFRPGSASYPITRQGIETTQVLTLYTESCRFLKRQWEDTRIKFQGVVSLRVGDTRLSFRYDQQTSCSIGDSAERNPEFNGNADLTLRGGSGGGGDGSYEGDFDKMGQYLMESRTLLCDMCDQAEDTPNPAQWKCLDYRCGLVLCGSAAHNHSQYHFEEFPSHMIQENIASQRIWCNDCQHEVLPYWQNRRPAPAVWVPPDGSDEEPPRGLYNIGNTCFMNAALQCMTAVTPLNSYFMGFCCGLAGRQVGSSYLWLLSEMWADQQGAYQKGVMPSRLLHSVRTAHPIFRGFHQHDTQEFLRLFMDTLTEETRIPHFVIDEQKKPEAIDESSSTSSDSETDSFETCDSGNGSEETGSVQNGDSTLIFTTVPGGKSGSGTLKDVKVQMKSIVSDIFDGKVESSVQCLSCKQFSRRLEVFQDLSLPIPTKDEMLTLKSAEKYDSEENQPPNNWINWVWDWFRSFFVGPTPSLEDCFSAFFSSDELKGKNMYSCEKCKKLRNGVKRCSLYQLPEVLCVHLKRFRLFEYGGGIGFSGKVSQYVQFPLDGLDLKRFLHSDCPNKVTNYRLLGTIVHMGSFTGGHYIAYIRRGDQWYVCDDSRVTPVTPETVTESEAYVLFY